jgi:uroporphyrinogen decarboxylase
MRQAGRHLPEYREIRKDNSFHDVVQNPELAAEVTMQPVERYGMDAAIIFSDILVIPEALGQPYTFPEGGGIEMEFAVDTPDAIDRLDISGVADRLDYVAASLSATRRRLGDDRALIGFSGAPWTLATYMIEGESSDDKLTARSMLYEQPAVLDRLLDKLVDAVIEYLQMQISAGADAVQLFDSWAGCLTPDGFDRACVQPIRRIADAIDEVPVIVLAKDMAHLTDGLEQMRADVQSVGWTASLRQTADTLPDEVAVQGNLDPIVVDTTPDIARRHTRRLLDEMADRPGHIFNLGHGIHPSADPDTVAAMVDTIRASSDTDPHGSTQ